MAGKSAPEAVRAFVLPIQRAISCFVSGKIEGSRYDGSGDGVLTLNRNQRVRLPGPGRVSIELLMNYRVYEHPDPSRGPWKVSTTGWIYHLFDQRDTAQVQYHWHPRHNVGFPHLHHGDGGLHYPTGRVLVEDVLLAATELGATPGDDSRWAEVQEQNRAMFVRGATWGVGPDPAGAGFS